MMKIKKIMATLSIMSILSVAAMEDKKAQKIKKEKDALEREFLMYPEDVDLKIDEKKLPKGVESLLGSNIFLVPKGMDAKLIHPTLEPKRIADFEVSMTQ
jgi:hypothetical protein